MPALCAEASRLAIVLWVAAAVLGAPRVVSSEEAGSGHAVHLFPPASDALGRQGLARVINHSARAGAVSIRAFDDSGAARGPLTLSIGANETVHFTSNDLEDGNAAKGLSGGIGPGEGNWRLELSSGLDIEVLSYVRTAEGFLTAMHDAAPSEGGRHRVVIFNPGSNRNNVSLLRLVNPGGKAAKVSVAGVDDAGASPGAGATATVPAGGSRTYTAAELDRAVAAAERAAGGRRVFVAATRTFADLPMLAAAKGVDDPAPPPPLAPDPASIASRAEGFRSAELARNPSLYYMNAARANDLLAQLIRQIEWIDLQLRRRGRSKATATDYDVRQIAITSLIGHGLVDLEAATAPR